MLTLTAIIWRKKVEYDGYSEQRQIKAPVRVDKIRIRHGRSYEAHLAMPEEDAPHQPEGEHFEWVYFSKKENPGVPVLQEGWTLLV